MVSQSVSRRMSRIASRMGAKEGAGFGCFPLLGLLRSRDRGARPAVVLSRHLARTVVRSQCRTCMHQNDKMVRRKIL
jgi:hypothetical protein